MISTVRSFLDSSLSVKKCSNCSNKPCVSDLNAYRLYHINPRRPETVSTEYIPESYLKMMKKVCEEYFDHNKIQIELQCVEKKWMEDCKFTGASL